VRLESLQMVLPTLARLQIQILVIDGGSNLWDYLAREHQSRRKFEL